MSERRLDKMMTDKMIKTGNRKQSLHHFVPPSFCHELQVFKKMNHQGTKTRRIAPNNSWVNGFDFGGDRFLALCLCAFVVCSSALAQILPTRPVIIEQPMSQTVDLGTDVTFAVSAASFLDVRYQWQRFKDDAWQDIPAASEPTLFIPEPTIEDVGEYRVSAANSIGTRMSQEAELRFKGRPQIIRQPQSQSVSLGPDVKFSVFSIGSDPLTYQWSWNGMEIEGATEPNLVIKTRSIDQQRVEVDIGGLITDEIPLNEHFAGDEGTFVVIVRNTLDVEISDEAVFEINTTFTKVTEDPILNVPGSEGAWGDYDGDGDLDVYAAIGDPPLFQNDGKGNFVAIPNTGLPVGDANSNGGIWVDYDNDGDQDLYILNRGKDFLYRNEGNGFFENSDANGIGISNRTSTVGSWGDFDNDGNIDLFIATGQLLVPELNLLYRNQGDGDFAEVDLGNIVNEPTSSLGSTWADYDNDGDLDLFLTDLFPGNASNSLYRNNGNQTFTKLFPANQANNGGASASADWGDYDNDGDLDLIVGAEPTFLFRNEGDGGFQSLKDFPFIPQGGKPTWGDYDNDGDLDVFVSFFHGQKNELYRNDGGGCFVKVSGSPSNDRGNSISGSWIDVDNDGFLDLFVNNREPAFLYRNNTNGNHWIRVKCVGTLSNRDGIGAKVRVKASVNGRDLWQLRQITGGGATSGHSSSLDAHFGLGDTSVIETLRVEWPSGIVQEMADVSVDQILFITEPNRPVNVQPKHAVSRIGGEVTFVAGTDLEGALTYQWQLNGADLAGESNATLTITNVREEDYGQYTILVGEDGTLDLVGAMTILIVPEPPTILWQPQQKALEIGTEVFFEVQASGSPPLSYRWQKDGADAGGAGGSVLRIENFQLRDAGVYRVLVSNDFGEVWSDDVKLSDPDIDVQPADQSVSLGADTEFSVEVSGVAPLTYQWQKDDVVIPGAVAATLKVIDVRETDAGLYHVIVSNPLGTSTSRVVGLEVDHTFTKMPRHPLVAEDGIRSVAWADYDEDGDLDVFVARADVKSITRPADNRLYLNVGEGNFVRITDSPIDSDGGSSAGSAWGDFDNDGDLDLFVTTFLTRDPPFLYQNLGDSSFERITSGLIATEVQRWSVNSSWIDYDNDGLLDLFVTRWAAENNLLYRNHGRGNLFPVIDSPLIQDGSKSIGIGWADIDQDGYLDLFVSNGNILDDSITEPTLLYKNNGDGSFTPVLDSPLVADDADRWFCEWGDYDNDGDFDLFVANQAGPNFLFRNLGDWNFEKITDGPIVENSLPSTGGSWGDYDNDGDLDLIVTNGIWTDSARDALFRNDGDGQFTRITEGSIVNELNKTFASAWADYNGDGYLDLYLVNHPSEIPTAKLFQNNLKSIGNDNHWIKIKCVGTIANRSAIGAEVRVRAIIRGEEVWQLRQIVGGGSWGNSGLEAHFGLGDAEIIDEIRIKWPGPAFLEDRFYDVPVDQLETFVEGESISAGPRLQASFQDDTIHITLTAEVGQTYELQASGGLDIWETIVELTIEANATASYTDSSISDFNQRFYRAVEVSR